MFLQDTLSRAIAAFTSRLSLRQSSAVVNVQVNLPLASSAEFVTASIDDKLGKVKDALGKAAELAILAKGYKSIEQRVQDRLQQIVDAKVSAVLNASNINLGLLNPQLNVTVQGSLGSSLGSFEAKLTANLRDKYMNTANLDVYINRATANMDQMIDRAVNKHLNELEASLDFKSLLDKHIDSEALAVVKRVADTISALQHPVLDIQINL